MGEQAEPVDSQCRLGGAIEGAPVGRDRCIYPEKGSAAPAGSSPVSLFQSIPLMRRTREVLVLQGLPDESSDVLDPLVAVMGLERWVHERQVHHRAGREPTEFPKKIALVIPFYNRFQSSSVSFDEREWPPSRNSPFVRIISGIDTTFQNEFDAGIRSLIV